MKLKNDLEQVGISDEVVDRTVERLRRTCRPDMLVASIEKIYQAISEAVETVVDSQIIDELESSLDPAYTVLSIEQLEEQDRRLAKQLSGT